MHGVVYEFFCFFFKQKTAYEMRISDWSSDVCSSDLRWDRGDRNDRANRWVRNRADWNDHARSNDRFHNRAEFNRRWRDDRRYDWRDYRTRNRATYRLPRYYAPHGWEYGYRR